MQTYNEYIKCKAAQKAFKEFKAILETFILPLTAEKANPNEVFDSIESFLFNDVKVDEPHYQSAQTQLSHIAKEFIVKINKIIEGYDKFMKDLEKAQDYRKDVINDSLDYKTRSEINNLFFKLENSIQAFSFKVMEVYNDNSIASDSILAFKKITLAFVTGGADYITAKSLSSDPYYNFFIGDVIAEAEKIVLNKVKINANLDSKKDDKSSDFHSPNSGSHNSYQTPKQTNSEEEAKRYKYYQSGNQWFNFYSYDSEKKKGNSGHKRKAEEILSPYEILGVTKNATPEEIKNRRNVLLKKHQKDGERLKIINDAYDKITRKDDINLQNFSESSESFKFSSFKG